MAWELHVDGVACIVESVGSFVDKDYVGIGLKYGFDGIQCAPMIHGLFGGGFRQACREFSILLPGLGLQGCEPLPVGLRLLALHFRQKGIEGFGKIAHYRGCYRDIYVYFRRLHVHLDKFHLRIPFAAPEGKHPVESGSNNEDDVGFFHNVRAA